MTHIPQHPLKNVVSLTLLLFIVLQMIPICPVYADDSNQIEQMKYLFEFKFKDSEEKIQFSTNLQLDINHTGFDFPGNGTLRYYVHDPLSDVRLLLMLDQVFPTEYVNYLMYHESDEYYYSYYSNRTESTDPSVSANTSYTIFWMHETMEEITNYVNFGRVYFFNTSAPKSLVVDEIVTISHGPKRWSDTFAGKLFNPYAVTCFKLLLEVSIGDDETFVHCYYDRGTGMLMYAHMYIKRIRESERTIGELKIHHISGSFSISQSFNWWFLATIGASSLIAVAIGWMTYNFCKNDKKKHPSRLDQI
ncbi:MAG: hypothetical protein JW776_04085 [Candidatus Lokiarchaeota archaeon]|nr:hypothetical protein [Candidatus Lokiarchaeota archaeon]